MFLYYPVQIGFYFLTVGFKEYNHAFIKDQDYIWQQ